MTRELKKIRKRTSEKMVWDYSQEQWVILPVGMPTDDEIALSLIPQDEGYRDAYQLRRDQGWTPFQAFRDIYHYILDWHKGEAGEIN